MGATVVRNKSRENSKQLSATCIVPPPIIPLLSAAAAVSAPDSAAAFAPDSFALTPDSAKPAPEFAAPNPDSDDRPDRPDTAAFTTWVHLHALTWSQLQSAKTPDGATTSATKTVGPGSAVMAKKWVHLGDVGK